MYDFKFLGAPASANTALVVYRYNSGIWRRRILHKLDEREGEPLGRAMVDEMPLLLAGNSLFGEGGRIVCDLGEKLDRKAQDPLGAIAVDLERGRPLVAALLIAEGNPLQESLVWRNITKGAVLVTEPAVSESTIGPLLRFLAETTDLASSPACINQPGFVRCFTDLQDSKAALPELIHRFEILLASSDPNTNLVNVDEAILAGTHHIALKGFDDLIAHGGESQIATVITAVAQAIQRGYSAEGVMNAVVTRIGRLLRSGRRGSRAANQDGPVLRAIVVAGLILAAWMELLPTSPLARETIVSRWDALLRAFVARATHYDPLEGMWAQLNEVVASATRSKKQKTRILRRLADFVSTASNDIPIELRPDWVERLLQNLRRPLVVQRLRRPRPIKYAGPPLQSLDDVIGQSGAVRTLKSLLPRYREPSDGTRGKGHPPLLFLGPDGVGKTALSRLFAKAVLCDQPAGGSACSHCPSCKSFDAENSMGYEPAIDATKEGLEARLAGHVQDAGQPHLAARSVITIDQVDRCDPNALDVLLKTLEYHVPRLVYLFLASSERDVGAALRSRSIEIVLRPLGHRDANTLLAPALAAFQGRVDNVEAVLAVGQGLPSRLLALANGTLGAQTHMSTQEIDLTTFISPASGGTFVTQERQNKIAFAAAKELVMRHQASLAVQQAEWDQVASSLIARVR